VGLLIIILPIVLFVLGSVSGLIIGMKEILSPNNSIPNLLPLALRSVALSVFTGFVLMGILSLVALTYRSSKLFDKFLLSYVPLSTVLIALGFLLIHLNLGFIEPDIKVVIAMVILFLPVLYRLELKTRLQSLDSQVEVAQLMGASHALIFNQIVFPQVFPSILFLSGLGAFWTIGDFAISQIIYGEHVTLALYIQSLVGSYKLELANVLVFLLLFLGFFVFILFREMRHVVSQKN
jgi:ABC-type Fe3+ transport system permease subunit